MRLNVLRSGAAAAATVPLVIAHGLFGSGRNWGAVARRLGERREVLAVDMRNHGESPWSDAHGYAAMAEDLAEVIAGAGGRADVLGHSMGGKAAMMLALTDPGKVRRLVVADMAPAAYGHSQLRYVQAMQGVDLSRVTRRADADAALAETVPDRGLRAFLLQSLAIGEGGAAWKLNLDALAAEMPEIMGFPPIETRFEGPVLFLTGETSDYVRPEHRARIAALFPAARIETIAAAGHWLHADQPAAFAAAVESFLDAADRC